MKTFHNIVQGVLSHELGYGLMNGDKDPKGSYCATVIDQLYLHECNKAFTLKTDVWALIVSMYRTKDILSMSKAELIKLRDKLHAEHRSNMPIMLDMFNHYAFFKRRAVAYHNSTLRINNSLNRYIASLQE